jgi:poly(3-hydroxybutyrate) depolymerase
MIWLLLCSLLFTSVSQDNSKHATGQIVKESIDSGGRSRTYYLFVPTRLAPGAPMIVTLHGSGRDGRSLVEKWKDIAASEGIVLAGPDSLSSTGWSAPQDGPEFLHDVIEAVGKKYGIDPRRVYLFGHSAGASFALNISMLESGYFAATAVHAGAMDQQTYPLIDLAKRKIPIALFVGTRDQFFPLSKVRATRDALQVRGFSVLLTEMVGHDHDYYGRSAEINRNAWEFLRARELPGEPSYEQHRFK